PRTIRLERTSRASNGSGNPNCIGASASWKTVTLVTLTTTLRRAGLVLLLSASVAALVTSRAGLSAIARSDSSAIARSEWPAPVGAQPVAAAASADAPPSAPREPRRDTSSQPGKQFVLNVPAPPYAGPLSKEVRQLFFAPHRPSDRPAKQKRSSIS